MNELTQPPTLYLAKRIHTRDPAQPQARGLLVADGRVVDVGSNLAELRRVAGEVIDLGDAVVLPGLVDAHFHLAWLGRTLRQLDLRAVRSVDELWQRVRELDRSLASGEWLVGTGWDTTDWPARALPSADELERELPGRRVWLVRVDGHAALASRAALAVAGLGEHTVVAEGGELGRGADGRLDGLVVDRAMEAVERLLPKATDDELEREFVAAQRACLAAGLVGGHEMSGGARELNALARLDARGALAMMVDVYLSCALDETMELVAKHRPSDRLRIRGVKLFADGALGSHGALLREPYADAPHTCGLAVTQADELRRIALAAANRGLAVAIHAIGDAAADAAVAALAALPPTREGVPHRLEHAELLHDEHIATLARVGAVASMQPVHYVSDARWLPARIGASRLPLVSRFASVLAAGGRLCFGSDAPVESENPWLGLEAAVNRDDGALGPLTGRTVREALSLDAALHAHTEAAYAAVGREGGRLVAGAPAHFVAVDRDPFEVTDLKQVQTLVAAPFGRPARGVGGDTQSY